MLALIVALVSLTFTQGSNLLVDAGFVKGSPGWDLYARANGAATAEVEEGRNEGNAVKVVHRGEQDWAYYQTQSVPAQPDDVFELSAWLKAQDLSNASISVVTLDSKGETLEWLYGGLGTSGTHDWKHFAHRIVVPAGCAAIRFRLVGYGRGTVWMDSPSLKRVGRVEDFVALGAKPVELSNPKLRLTLQKDGAVSAVDRRSGRKWQLGPASAELRVKSIERASPLSAALTLVDIGANLTFRATFTLLADAPEADVFVEGSGPIDQGLAYPGPIETAAGQWLIVPMNEGILYPVDDPEAPSLDLVTYSGHGVCMPWYGVVDPKTGAGAMGIVLTPDDAVVRLERSANKMLQPRPVWQASRQELRYSRRVRLSFFDRGGYIAMAKRYRKHAIESGLLVTLKEKVKRAPSVDRLIGAVNVWNWDMDPVALAKELKGEGMDHVLWSRGGSAGELKTLNDMGFLTSRYDIYQDVWDPKIALSWMNTQGWPDDLVRLPNGDWMKGWAHPDKQPDGTVKWLQGGVISSGAGLRRAEHVIPAELKDHPYHCRFIDTTTASPWREDYNPLHPLTRSEDRKNKMALLDFCSKDMGLVVGTETGIDPSVPYVHYYEGMMSLGPYRLPDAGTDMIAYRKPTPDFIKYQVGSFFRLPLWELVYHDCTVAQWYWGDATNKAPEVWDQRDLLNILYGTAPLLLFDHDRWQRDKARMKKTYDDVCRWDRQIGYDELVSHEFLTADHTVQRTRFSSGKGVTVNFGPAPWTQGSITVPPKGFRISP